jgi:hypothetical protein
LSGSARIYGLSPKMSFNPEGVVSDFATDPRVVLFDAIPHAVARILVFFVCELGALPRAEGHDPFRVGRQQCNLLSREPAYLPRRVGAAESIVSENVIQPRRGCVTQPRVRRTLGTTASYLPNPNGVVSKSQQSDGPER